MAIGIIYAILFWIATLVLILGVANKLIIYAKIPAPLKIPITPAPVSRLGVGFRMLQEVLLFKSLFRADKQLWLISLVFHYALLLIVICHFKYILDALYRFNTLIQLGKYAGFVLVLSLVALLLRRILIDRVRYISSPSDIAMLLLLIGIGCSGLLMSFVTHTNVYMVRQFFIGLLYFDWQPLPLDFVLLTHLGSVAFLMLIFPISKLLHAPGVFFSPTRNQVDNPREKRHIAAWASDLEKSEKKDQSSLDDQE